MEQLTFDNCEDFKASVKYIGDISWSPKLDSFVVATSNTDIWLYRQNMSLIWRYSICSNSSIKCIVWHPDSVIFIVCLNDGTINFFSIHNSYLLYQFKIDQDIKYIKWFSSGEKNVKMDLFDINEILPLGFTMYQNSNVTDELKKLSELLKLKNISSMLIVISKENMSLYYNGVLNCGSIFLKELKIGTGESIIINSLNFSSDYQILSFCYINEKLNETEIRHMSMKTSFHKYFEVVCRTASIYVDILFIKTQLNLQLKEIHNNWEDWYQEYNKFLIKLEGHNKETSCGRRVKNQIIKLILFGSPIGDYWTVNGFMREVDRLSARLYKSTDYLYKRCLPCMHQMILRMLFSMNELSSLLTHAPVHYLDLPLFNTDIKQMIDICSLTLLKMNEFQMILSNMTKDFGAIITFVHSNYKIYKNLNENEYQSHHRLLSAHYNDTLVNCVMNNIVAHTDQKNEVSHYTFKLFGHEVITSEKLPYLNIINKDNCLLNFIEKLKRDEDDNMLSRFDGLFPIFANMSLSTAITKHLNNALDNFSLNIADSFINIRDLSVQQFSQDITILPDERLIFASKYFVGNSSKQVTEVTVYYEPSTVVLVWIICKNNQKKYCAIQLSGILSDEEITSVIDLKLYDKHQVICLLGYKNRLEPKDTNHHFCQIVLHKKQLNFSGYSPISNPFIINELISLTTIPKTAIPLPLEPSNIQIDSAKSAAITMFASNLIKYRVYSLKSSEFIAD